VPTAPTVAELCQDLAAEHDALDAVLTGLPAAAWATATPAAGWDIRAWLAIAQAYVGPPTVAAPDR
jgi:hypothetical protein